MKIRISKDEIIETDNHSVDELRALRDHLIVEVSQLKGRIQEEWQKAKENGGTYEDPDRYSRMIVAKKKLGTNIEHLKEILSDRRRAENIGRNNLVNQEFVSLCRERMPKELFVALIHEATARAARATLEPAVPEGS